MDIEKNKKKQSLKVIISEAIMVLAVVVTVAILALVVSGYWVNSDFKVEQNGMLQISSVPTGANVNIDGEASSWLQRTNTSKILSSGEHTVTLSKDGYDTWSKTINVPEGLLYRLHYPRLFWQQREPKNVQTVTGATYATISPDGERLLLANGTTEWQLIDLTSDTITPKKLNVADCFTDISLADGATVGVFSGKIADADWDHDSNHVLFKVETATGSTEWVLMDVGNVKNSFNLTKEFGADFTKVEILDNSSTNLLVVRGGNLHRIDVPGKAISAVLVNEITDFDHYENEVVFAAANHSGATTSVSSGTNNAPYMVGLLKIGDGRIVSLETTEVAPRVAISKFYDDMYITTLTGDTLQLYKKTDFVPYAKYQLSFAPREMLVGHNGEFITMNDGETRIATLDMEASAVREWSVEGKNYDWLDNDMIYTVAGGELVVYDYDGLNRRILAQNVSSHFPAVITDNKWLYYFSDDNLIREKIIE